MSNPNEHGAQPDRNYVQKYLDKAETTNNELVKNDCLYRVATNLEIGQCDGNANLSKAEQQAIIQTAKVFLNDEM